MSSKGVYSQSLTTKHSVENGASMSSSTAAHQVSQAVSTLEGTSKKKKRKKVPKEERQRRREEEKLKRIYGPKDSRVQLISAEVLQKLNNNSATPSKPTLTFLGKDDFPLISSNVVEPKTSSPEDFPPLTSRAITVIKVNVPEKLSPKVDAQKANLADDSGWETENEGNEETCEDCTTPIILGNVDPVAGSSKRKSTAPILISLDALISKKALEKNKRKDGKKTREQKPALEKKTIGNLLDSSGPVLMNRGKIRENPKKKKITTLKKTIMISRSLRAKRRDIKVDEDDVVNQSEKHLPEAQETLTSEVDVSSGNILDPSTNVFEKASSASPRSNQLKQSQVPNPSKSTENAESCKFALDGANGTLSDNKLATSTEGSDDKLVLNSAASSVPQNVTSIRVNSTDDTNLFATLLDNAILEQTNPKVSEIPPVVILNDDERGISAEVFAEAKKSIHNRKFRDYCNMYTSKELHGHVIALMKELHRFQDRLYHTDPVKFQTKRRFVHGLKDTLNYLCINKAVLVILAPDLEPNNIKGGLDDKISQIMLIAKGKGVPVIFSGNRYILGKPIMIKSPVSAIAVLDKHGAEPFYNAVIEEAAKLRQKYSQDFEAKLENLHGNA